MTLPAGAKGKYFLTTIFRDDIISIVDTTTLAVDTTVLLSDEVILDMKDESDGNQIIKYISIKIKCQYKRPF